MSTSRNYCRIVLKIKFGDISEACSPEPGGGRAAEKDSAGGEEAAAAGEKATERPGSLDRSSVQMAAFCLPGHPVIVCSFLL